MHVRQRGEDPPHAPPWTRGPLHVRPYRPGDEASINRGFNEVFSLQRSLEEWRWKFARSVIAVGLDEQGEVLTHYAAFLVDMQVHGRLYPVGNGVDVYSRRQPGTVTSRLFLRTAEAFFSTFGGHQVPFFYGFPGERSNRLGKLRLGHGQTAPVRSFVKDVRRRLRWPSRLRVGPVELPQIEALWPRVADRYPVAVRRDAAWARWRYLEHPTRRYQLRGVWSGTRLLGWTALLATPPLGSLVDLVWDGEKPALALLEADAEEQFRRSACSRMELWLAGDEAALDVLRSRGWKEGAARPLPDLLVLSFTPEIVPERLAERLYYTLGDSDLL